MIKGFSILSVSFFLCASALGQVDFNKQYFNAKQLFREGKYNLAMESFKPLIPYDKDNPFSEYASFYYALAAYHQGYGAVARDEFMKIKTLYPKWEKIDEVNFWLGKIHLEKNEYFQGLKMLNAIADRKMYQDAEVIKAKSLASLQDIETLKRIREEYPRDETVLKALVRALSKNISVPADKNLFETLVKNYSLKRSDYLPEAPKTFHKDVYTVSVVMPFLVNTLEPTPSKKKNQIVLDFYEGMKLAVDTLKKGGVNISLRAYDTDRNVSKINTILNTEEVKNTDLIVGPFFQDENKPIQDFSLRNKVNVINPFLNNSDLVGQNPYAFLFQPAVETVGKKSGDFLASYALKPTCMVFYGPSKRDSILAASFSETAKAKGLNIVSQKMVTRETAGAITTMLATPTEFDEFKFPKEFTIKKDSIGSIFVATDEPLIYTKVISAVDTRRDNIFVLGSEAWLDQSAIDLEKYRTLPLVLSAPMFVSSTDPEYVAFLKKFISVHSRVPSNHAKMGYELMLFFGHQLKKHGVYFQEGLNQQELISGYLMEGYNFQFSRWNQLVPFIRYEDGQMKVVGKR